MKSTETANQLESVSEITITGDRSGGSQRRGASHFDQFEKDNKGQQTMTNNPNELTIENSVLVLIDHQPAVAISVHLLVGGVFVFAI